ncbi:hypothetical protein PAPYR_7658 [Paratrimastix pyriformis]|uniref:Nudix hydrolase domain-containing protein n=1 Tax=Paratrimastix pyriformis TaxID=342808 RepID=A0ABQ8UCL5_9EUKA|nr:hypothetical protein PAPYR_7658 [Paratrimastix pyriformis]
MASSGPLDGDSFDVVQESKIFQRYLQVWDRKVHFPNTLNPISFDVVSSISPQFVVIFPFDCQSETVTLIREYCQGPHRLCWSLPCGGFTPGKHSTLAEAAQFELSEEAHLCQGTWIHLGCVGPRSPPTSCGTLICEGKWIANSFAPFLCLNPVRDRNPRAADAEERIEIVSGVPLDRLFALILAGELLPPSVQTSIMALHHLGVLQLSIGGPPIPIPAYTPCSRICCSPVQRSCASSPLSPDRADVCARSGLEFLFAVVIGLDSDSPRRYFRLRAVSHLWNVVLKDWLTVWAVRPALVDRVVAHLRTKVLK